MLHTAQGEEKYVVLVFEIEKIVILEIVQRHKYVKITTPINND